MSNPNLQPPGAIHPPPNPGQTNLGFAITALVLGIVAFVGSWLPFVSLIFAVIGVVGLAFGIGAILMSAKGTATGKGLAITGTMLSAVAILFAAASTILGFSAISSIGKGISDQTQTAGFGSGAGLGDVDVDPLVVVDKQVWRSSTDRWNYFVLIDNPSDEVLYNNWRDDVTVELLDAEGTILTADSSNPTIMPGSQTAVVGSFRDSSAIADDQVNSVDVFLPETPQLASAEQRGSLATADIEASEGTLEVVVVGIVESTFTQDQENIFVDVVAFDEDGDVVTRNSKMIDRIPAEGKGRFQVSLTGIESLEGMTFQAWARARL